MSAEDAPIAGPVRALVEMIAARIGLPAVGYLDTTALPARPVAATAAFRSQWDAHEDALGSADWTATAPQPWPDPAFAAAVAQPVRIAGMTVGLLVALDAESPAAEDGPAGAVEGLEAGAEILALLLRAPHGADAADAQGGRIVARGDLHRAIEARAPDAAPALILVDIDRFSAINAALGAPAGDSLLAITATRLARSIGPRETLLRPGADRFLILSERPADDLPCLAARLLENLSEPVPLAGETVTLQATLGVVSGAAAGLAAETLLMQAEAALRRGKSEGGNRIVHHEAAAEAALQERFRLEVDLGQAIELEQLRLVFQPYVALDTGRVSGVEALLRWDHPLRGELTPAAFIGLAERTGKILPIGDWTLREALARAADWPDGPRLSVNISALQFRQPDFTRKVDAALAATGFPAERLELEITETVLMRDNPETIGQLRTLINRGVRIALDDFGTGYSALAYLARLPHHRIKLDRCFVQDLGNPRTADLLRAIVDSARAQGVLVTAEGVETEAQLAEVRRMGFTHVQGFATGAPVADPGVLWRVGEHAPA